MAAFQPQTHEELMATFAVGEDAIVLRDVVEPVARGPRHQPRVPAGSRVRIRGVVHVGAESLYGVEVCDARGATSGCWALIAEDDLAEAPELDVRDWLRARNSG